MRRSYYRKPSLWMLSLMAVGLLLPGHGVLAATKQKVSVNSPKRIVQVTDFDYKAGDFASALVVDARTHKVLFSYEPDKKWPAASLTKLMGALVLLDQKPKWNKVVNITAKDEVGGGRLRVNDGATLTIKDVLYSSIVGSANNAATAMARITKLGKTKFVSAMNSKAKALGCKSTTFVDPSGMDTGNETTAHDLLKIAETAFAQPAIQHAASTPVYTFHILNASPKYNLHTIHNTDVLLTDSKNGLYVTGGKTGYLDEAKNNLVVRLRPSRENTKQELMVVVFGAETRQSLFDEAARLARWSWSAYDWSAPSVAKAYGD